MLSSYIFIILIYWLTTIWYEKICTFKGLHRSGCFGGQTFYGHDRLILSRHQSTNHICDCKVLPSSAKLWMVKPENTHLLRKGKYHCMVDLLFVYLRFDQTCKSLSDSPQAKQLNPHQSNMRSVVQWYFPLWTKWVFSCQAVKFSQYY